jgi:tRNA/tmRNA/rRNA uracil-C5-methylase (TrmA/RlmC/RlmD family)
VREVFGGVGVHYPPDAFGQSYLALAEQLSDRIAEWVPEGAGVVEFYAGSGSIGIRLLARSREVAFNERAPGGLHGLELGLAERPIVERERARVVAGAAGECAELARGAEVVIADPPRRGLDAELLRALCEAPPQCFLYASCGLDSFARELPELCAPGRLRLAALEVFDLFPFTAHIETLARFERA